MTALGAGTSQGDPLRPFTSTAQVPAVAHHLAMTDTGQVPIVFRQRRPVPLGLRIAVWANALLVVAGAVVLGLDKAHPAWFATTHAAKAAPRAHVQTTTPRRAAAPANGGSATMAAVRQTQSGSSSATWAVADARYSVVVTTQSACWVEVTTPGSSSPVFASVMAAGAHQTFHPSSGQLVLQLGASKVTVEVLLAGRSSPAWQWTPTAAPYQLSFTATS